MVVTWLVMAVAESSCSEGVRPAVNAGRTWGVTESKTASGSSVAFASGMRSVSEVDISVMALAVSSARVPVPTVARSTSVGSLVAMSVKLVAVTQRGEKSALARLERRSLMVVPRAAVANRVREEEGRSRAMIAVMAVRACSASSASPPEAFHDRIEEMSACWARTCAPVPFVEVSPVVGLTLTRAMEVKGTSSVGVSAEVGAMAIWSAAAKLDRKVVPKVASSGQPTLRRIVGPESGLEVMVPLGPVAEGVGLGVADADGEAVGDVDGVAEGLGAPGLWA